MNPTRLASLVRRVWKEWTIAVLFAAIALAGFAKIGEDVFEHESGTFDGAVQAWMQAHQSGLADAIFLAITYCGSVGASFAVAVLAAYWLWTARGRRIAATVVLAPAVATVLFNVIKLVFARPRPTVLGHIVLRTFSFPSGHATASAAVWCTLSYVTHREDLSTRRLAMVTAIVPPLLIGLSRIYLGVHWTTDVLGGWCLGVLVSAVAAWLYERHRGRAGERASGRAGEL